MTKALEAVRRRLDEAAEKGPVPLGISTLDPEGADVVRLIQEHLGVPEVVLDLPVTIRLPEPKTLLAVEGTAVGELLGIDRPRVAAGFSVAANGTTLLVVLDVITNEGWSVGVTFPLLGFSDFAQLPVTPGTTPRFQLRSEAGRRDAYGAVQEPGLNLAMEVDVASHSLLDVLAPIHTLRRSSVALEGLVTVRPEAEAARLRGATGSSGFEFGAPGLPSLSMVEPVAAVAARAWVEQGIPASSVEVQIWGRASIGDALVPLGFGAPLGLGMWSLFVVPGQRVRLLQVVGFFPGVSLLDALPPQVKTIVDVEIAQFSVRINDDGGWTVSDAQVVVESAQTWTVVPKGVELKDVAVALNLQFPGPVVTGYVSGTVRLGDEASGAVDVSVSIPIPIGAGHISLTSNPNATLPGLGALAGFVGGDYLRDQLPESISDVGAFKLSFFTATIDPARRTLVGASFSLGATRWDLVADQLAMERLAIALEVDRSSGSAVVTGEVSGVLVLAGEEVALAATRFGPAAPWRLAMDATDVRLPSLLDIAELASIDLADVVPAGIASARFVISVLSLDADLTRRKPELFELVAVAEDAWEVVPGKFSLDQIAAALTIDWRSGARVVTGRLDAVLDFGDGDDDSIQMGLSAERASDGDWMLTGELLTPVDIGRLVETALGSPPSTDFGNVSLDVLKLTYRTLSGSYEFSAGARWQLDIGEAALDVAAAVTLERERHPTITGAFTYSGSISGALRSHFGTNRLDLSATYLFQGQTKTSFLFDIRFNGRGLVCTYARAANADTVLTARLVGVTFADVVRFLVELARPGASFRLDPPWDVLNSIRFDDVALVLNLTQRTIGIEYTVDANLGLADVRTIGLTFLHRGGSPTVEVSITGSFTGRTYPPERPLRWDLLNETPPAPAGQGAAAFSLKDLGVGQHVRLADPKATSMSTVLAAIRAVVTETKGKPRPWTLLQFDPDAGWTVGAQFTVMGAVTLGLVFDDPALYGVQVALTGPKAGPLAGLEFEILYRKVSDDVGVYHVELELPAAMRHLELGAVSVTLPEIVLDLYTDGGFYVNMGFPLANDWSRCFGLQAFPFVGYGGFYLSRTTVADAARAPVPPIANGNFSPIVEFGFALAVGIGKTIEQGPLSAALSLTAQGILKGVVAWFNPDDESQPPDRYHRVEGSIAIVGRLYGTVDFKVVTVNLSVVASVTASLAATVYEPMWITLSVQVTVEASVKVLLIWIHFSFSFRMNASFSIGSAATPPWQVKGRGPVTTVPFAARLASRGEPGSAHVVPLLRARTVPGRLQWTPAEVLDGKAVVDVALTPVFTVGGDPASVRVVTLPVVATTAPAHPGTATELRRPDVTAAGTADASFDTIVEALVKWGMQVRTGAHSGPLTLADAHLVYEDLSAADTGDDGFAYANVTAFIEKNLVLQLHAPNEDAGETSGAVLPMMPPVQMTPEGGPPVKFWETPKIGPQYESELKKLFAELAVNYDYDRAPDPFGPVAGPRTRSEALPEPIAEAVFADWFLLVARTTYQAVCDTLAAVSYVPGSKDSLATIAASFFGPVTFRTRSGDNADTIATLFGIARQDLVTANPGVDFSQLRAGEALVVPAAKADASYRSVPGDTLSGIASAWCIDEADLADANPDVDWLALEPGTRLTVPVPEGFFTLVRANTSAALAGAPFPLPGLVHRVQAKDTLEDVAAVYNTDLVALAEASAWTRDVLQPGAPIGVDTGTAANPGSIPYPVAADDTVRRIAAYLTVRTGPRTGEGEAFNWFANALAAANPTVDWQSPVPSGTKVSVPVVVRTDHGLRETGTTLYEAKPTDSLTSIAQMFVLVQLEHSDLAPLEAAIEKSNPIIEPGQTIHLPGRIHTIEPGDTLSELAARSGVTVAQLARRNAGAWMLRPEATLRLPPTLLWAPGDDATLTTVAGAAGLSVDELVGRVGCVKGLLSESQTLVVPDVREMDVEEILSSIAAGEAAGGTVGTNDIAAMASRFLLHGLRVPEPEDGMPTGPVRPLFEVLRQQFPLPDPPPEALSITFSVPRGETWVVPVENTRRQSAAGAAGDSADARGPRTEVVVSLDRAVIERETPSTHLYPQLLHGYPARVPLVQEAPVAHALVDPGPWAPAIPPRVGGRAAARGLLLWRLPPRLLAKLATDPDEHPYGLSVAPKGAPPEKGAPVETFAWATTMLVRLRRAVSASGAPVDGLYLLDGVDPVDRATLLSVWTHFLADAGQVAFAYSVPGSGELLSPPLDPSATAIIKTNLATETVAPGLAFDGRADAWSSLATPGAFLEMLWQASVVGRGGFYLATSAPGGDGLPPAVFAAGDEGTLTLICIPAQENDGARTLPSFCGVAVVEGDPDPGQVDLYACATDGSDVASNAVAPPGNVSFEVARKNPSRAPAASGMTPETRTRCLYNLLGLRVDGDGLAPPNLVLPLGPTDAPPTAADAAGSWYYQQTIPLFRLVRPGPRQAPEPFPPVAEDPYAAVTAGVSATLGFAFRDMFGNEVDGSDSPVVDVEPGYYDAVRGLSSWPGASGGFVFRPGGDGAVLDVTVSLGLKRFVPSIDVPFGLAVRAAAADRVAYQQICYQLGQPDVTCTIASSLDPPARPAATGDAVKVPLRALATAAYVYLGTAASVRHKVHTANEHDTLRKVADAYRLDVPSLARANAEEEAAALLKHVAIPDYHVVSARQTPAEVAAGANLTVEGLFRTAETAPLTAGAVLATDVVVYTPAPGDTLTSIAGMMSTDATALVAANRYSSGILTEGKDLSLGGVTVAIRSDSTLDAVLQELRERGVDATPAALGIANTNVPDLFVTTQPIVVGTSPGSAGDHSARRTHLVEPGETLARIANDQRTTVADLGLANAQRPGVVVAGTSVTVQEHSVEAVEGDDLVTLARRLTALGAVAGVAEVALALAAREVLTPAEPLALASYVVQRDDTLEQVLTYSSDFTIEHLAEHNQGGPADLFPPGTALVTGSVQYTPVTGDTLTTIAARAKVPLDAVAASSADLELESGALLVVPGVVDVDPSAKTSIFVPYDSSPGPTLDEVAVALDAGLAELGRINAHTPDLIAAGVEIDYPSHPVVTAPGDTLASLAARCGAGDPGEFAANATVATCRGLVAGGAVVLGPLPAPAGRTLDDIAAAGRVALEDLLSVNLALAGLVSPGITLRVGEEKVTSRKNDTLGSLWAALRQADPRLGFHDFARTCGGSADLLVQAARVILPPPRATFTVPMRDARPPTTFAPLTVTLTVARDPSKIDPAAANLPDVASNVTDLRPDLGGDIQTFARLFAAAFKRGTVALGAGARPGDVATQLWTIDFGDGGIASVTVEGSAARYLALPPLSTKLWEGTCPVRDYDPETGKLGPPQERTFSSVDLNVWMRTVAEAIDLLLSPAPAGVALSLAPSALDGMVAAKKTIAGALSRKVAETLGGPAMDPVALDRAKAALLDAMLVSLRSAYTTDAILQFPTTVTSPYEPATVGREGDDLGDPACVMTRTTVDGDTLESLASFFGTDPGSTAGSVQDLPGFFRQGATVRLGTESVAVRRHGTVREVATALGTDAATLGRDRTIAADATLIAPGRRARCFSPSASVAPRLAGSAAVERYTTQAGDGIAQLVTYFQVSRAAVAATLAATLAATHDVLDTGTTVTFDGRTATIEEDSTLDSLAVDLGATGARQLLMRIETPPGIGLFRADVTFPLGRGAFTPGPLGSFSSVAAYFDVSVGAVAEANAARPGVVLEDTVLVVGHRHHTVARGETLASIAGHLGVEVSELPAAAGITAAKGILDPTVVLWFIQVLPEMSVSSGKIPLTNGKTYLTLLLSTSAAAAYRNVIANVDFRPSAFELDVRPIEQAPGYASSDWLTFPVDGHDRPDALKLTPGQLQIPLPLRSYPPPPSINSLRACQTWSAPTTVARAKQWQVEADVDLSTAAQDDARLTLRFGDPSLAGRAVDELPSALAAFATAWPAMAVDVELLQERHSPSDQPRLAHLLSALEDLTTRVAHALAQPDPQTEAAALGDEHVYRLRWNRREVAPGTLPPLEVVRDSGGPDDVFWPAVFHAGRRLEADPPRDGRRRYHYPPDTPDVPVIAQTFVFPETAVEAADPRGFDALLRQRADLTAVTSRNVGLVSTAPTATRFLFETPPVSFPGPAVPLLETAAPILVTGETSLGAAIARVLREVLTSEGVPIPERFSLGVTCRYERRLTPDAGGTFDGIYSRFPVAFAPHVELTYSGIDAFAGEVGAFATEWLAQLGPVGGGRWILEVAAFSGTSTGLPRPLLRFSNVEIPAPPGGLECEP